MLISKEIRVLPKSVLKRKILKSVEKVVKNKYYQICTPIKEYNLNNSEIKGMRLGYSRTINISLTSQEMRLCWEFGIVDRFKFLKNDQQRQNWGNKIMCGKSD